MNRGGSVFRNGGSAWNTTILSGTSAAQTLTIPDSGTDLEIQVLLRGDTAAANVNLQLTWNGDTTSTNYFWQRGGGSGNAAVSAQGNTSVPTVMPAANGVASYYGYAYLYFPNFRNILGTMIRDCFLEVSQEASASNRTVHVVSYRRTTAGSGALTDKISSVTFTPAAGNWAAGSVFRFRVSS